MTGIDTHESFLARLRADADAAGVGAQVETRPAPCRTAPCPTRAPTPSGPGARPAPWASTRPGRGLRAEIGLILSVGPVSVRIMTAIATLGAVVLDCREPLRTAEFYSALLDVPITRTEDDWVQLAPIGGVDLAFQLAPDHVPPIWPGHEHPQQFHLDVDVPDLDVAEEQVLAIGAIRHAVQPGTTFRVFLDPAGHPFCLCACPPGDQQG